MGIKYLWNVLGTFYERKPLYELQGKKVAVDLSCWICEAQNVAEYQIQPRMYLRNLYFRTCYLLLMEVQPVFVLEGKAPELKFETIAARNAVQFKGAKPKTDGVKTGKDRTRFHFTLKQCEEMLGYMGLACITGKGEAESLCAYLNDAGLVDGCISQDSDCFAYGAKVVYRNFSISQQGAHAASGGAIDVYDISKVDPKLDFGRNKIIAMALLLGSDYSDGVHGVGKESVMKFFETVKDEETLEKLRGWRMKEDLYKSQETRLNDKNICTSCGHTGKLQGHNKNGCDPCGTNKGCDPFKYKDERLAIKNELNMRNKAIQDPDFPNEKLIDEFLTKKDNVEKLNLQWKQPNLVKFVKFSLRFLQWEELYSVEKLLPILTRWQVYNYEKVQNGDNIKGFLVPDQIKKVRNPKGIPSYEIIWSDHHNFFNGLIPDSQLVNQDLEKLWSSIEPQHLVEKAYPKLVEDFKLSKIKPKKNSKRKQKQLDLENGVDNLNKLLKNTSLTEQKPKRAQKPKKKPEEDTDKPKNRKLKKKTDENIEELEKSFGDLKLDKPKQIKTLDSFLKKAVINSHVQKTKEVLKEQTHMEKYQSTPTKTTKSTFFDSFNLDMSTFDDECADSDLSDIIDNIVSQKSPKYLKENLNKLGYEKVADVSDVTDKIINTDTPPSVSIKNFSKESVIKDLKRSSFLKNMDEIDLNQSSFFMVNPSEVDLFEKSCNQKLTDSGDSDSSLDEFEIVNNKIDNCDNGVPGNVISNNAKNSVISDDDNSFSCDNYVPLFDRIRLK